RAAPGLAVEVFASGLPSAREIALGAHGTVFVGSMAAGVVYAVTPHATGAPQVRIVASGLQQPVGVAFHDGALFVSATRRIVVLRNIEAHLDAPPKPDTLIADLPWREGDHDWKFIAFGPDGRLYVPIGAPCNICAIGHDYGKIMRFSADGTHAESIAFGIRNSVGLAWDARGALWFTDNGRDWLGDDRPSDELNRLDHDGQEFGYPFCHQGDLADPQFGAGHPCSAFTPPVVKLGAHVAALGLRFDGDPAAPAALRGRVLIAEHGSWNRSTPSGYRVVAVDPATGAQTVLLDDRAADGTVLGRPADVQPLPDGSVLISDERRGVLLRLHAAP
ncbi:PQQ-dependent sugar dehydrogenase, partial [Ameyamaea chiangmaiensis]